MGKDKKEKNPADAFRKDQRKKELLKLKKDREVVKGVRDLLNDPRKIDEEIAKAQKISDENKLDKSLKDKIKELQRMKDVANTRQLVLAAQGKKSLAEAESIIKPSIYQKNEGVWDDGNKASSSSHGHVKSASRISTEGLAPYARGDDANLAAQMPIPTSVMMPYATQAAPLQHGGRGPVMGGMAGIPLPPPRPIANMGAYNPALAHGMHPGGSQGYAVPPPPPRPVMSVGGFGVPPPPGPPPGHMVQGQFPPVFPPQMYSYPGMAMPIPGIMQAPPAYGYPPQFPQQGFAAPQLQYQQQHMQQQPRGPPKHQQQKDRKPRPARGSTEEVDPLDPAGRGYTERFGAAPPPRKPQPHPSAQETATAATVEPPLVRAAGREEDANKEVEQINAEVQPADTPAVPPPPPPAPVGFVAPSYAALSAEELMRRRHMVPTDTSDSAHVDEAPSGPPVGVPSAPSFPSFSYPTLSAEELLRRRHQLPADTAVPAEDIAADEFVPARPPVSYGAVLSAEELMRRRYMVQEAQKEGDAAETAPGPAAGPSAGPSFGPSLGTSAGAEYSYPMSNAEEELRRRYEIPDIQAEDVESDQEEEDQGPAPGPARGPPAGGHYSYQSYEQQPSKEEADTEELMRQRYEIPDVQAEDVEDEDDDHDDQENGYVSEDDVRSAGEPEPTFEDDDAVRSDEEDMDAEPLELNLRNLYPARLPASFTALPQSRGSLPLSSAAPVAASKPSGGLSSAINFNDYGDDEDEDEEVYEEVAPKVQPYAVSAPQAPAVLPARAPENFPVSSYYPEGVEKEEIPHAVVKGPKIVKTDRALTAFVPNAIKKKRLNSGTTPATTFSTSYRKLVAAEPVEHAGGEAEEEPDFESEPVAKAARHDYTASLHAATSALFRPSAAPAQVPSVQPAVRAPIAPIAFVPATASTVSVSKAPAAAPAASAEEDAMTLFFSEINQL